MTRRTLPFEVPENMPGAWRGLQERLNSFASRGQTVTVPLRDAHEGGRGLFQVVGGQLWGLNDSNYIANSRTCTALSTSALAKDVLYAVPFLHDNNHLITRVGVRVTTGVANAKAVVAIYEATDSASGAFYPGRRLWQSAEYAASAATVTIEENPNLTLTPGRMYWAVYTCGTAAPTINVLAVASVDNILGTSAGVGSIGPQSTHITVSRSYTSTLPETFPSGALNATGTPPAIFIGYTTTTTTGSLTGTFPLFTPADSGWTVKRAWLLAGSTKRGFAYFTVAVRLRTSDGATTLGTFDSRTNTAGPGAPFPVTGSTPADVAVPVGSHVEAYVTQRGWPVLSVNDCAVQLDLARSEV